MKISFYPHTLILLIIPIVFLLIAAPIASSGGDEDSVMVQGKKVFEEKGCVACHTIGGGKLAGPDLKGVTVRREEDWLKRWIKAPDQMVFTDPIAKEMLMEYFVPMPNQGLTDEEVETVIKYFKQIDSEDHDEDHEADDNKVEGKND